MQRFASIFDDSTRISLRFEPFSGPFRRHLRDLRQETSPSCPDSRRTRSTARPHWARLLSSSRSHRPGPAPGWRQWPLKRLAPRYKSLYYDHVIYGSKEQISLWIASLRLGALMATRPSRTKRCRAGGRSLISTGPSRRTGSCGMLTGTTTRRPGKASAT